MDGALGAATRPERVLIHGAPFGNDGMPLKADDSRVKVTRLPGGVVELKGRGDWERVRID